MRLDPLKGFVDAAQHRDQPDDSHRPPWIPGLPEIQRESDARIGSEVQELVVGMTGDLFVLPWYGAPHEHDQIKHDRQRGPEGAHFFSYQESQASDDHLPTRVSIDRMIIGVSQDSRRCQLENVTVDALAGGLSTHCLWL